LDSYWKLTSEAARPVTQHGFVVIFNDSSGALSHILVLTKRRRDAEEQPGDTSLLGLTALGHRTKGAVGASSYFALVRR